MKLDLSNIDLVAIGSTRIQETLEAINACIKYANFNNIYYFSNVKTKYQVPIGAIKNIKDYDMFVVHELPKFIQSDFCLTIHWDGFIVNPRAWTNEFYKYDYIGAPWPWMNYICGNGGFCLKSKKFLETQQKIIPEKLNINRPDDVLLCIDYRSQFEYHECKYAPKDVAQKFSTEYGGYHNFNSFGFHDFKVNPMFNVNKYEIR